MCWAFRSSQYIQNVVKNVEYYINKKWEKIPDHANPPWSINNIPETDVSPEILSTNET